MLQPHALADPCQACGLSSVKRVKPCAHSTTSVFEMQNHVTMWHMVGILGGKIGMWWPYKGTWLAYAGHTCGGLGLCAWVKWGVPVCRRACRPIISTFPIMQPLSACYFIAALEIGSVRILQRGDERVIVQRKWRIHSHPINWEVNTTLFHR